MGFSDLHHDKIVEDLGKQEESINALIRIMGFGNDLLAALEPLQIHCSKYRCNIALQKNGAICRIVEEELSSDKSRKIVLFAWHRDVMVDLYERLVRFNPLTLYRGSSEDSKKRAVRRFAKVKKYQVFISNIRAANTKIDLTSANQVGFVESSWNMSDNAQAIMRIHRNGQDRPVTVRWFGLENDIDDKIQKLIKLRTLEILRKTQLLTPNSEASLSG